jgi:hypothetical protein
MLNKESDGSESLVSAVQFASIGLIFATRILLLNSTASRAGESVFFCQTAEQYQRRNMAVGQALALLIRAGQSRQIERL